MTTRIKFKKRVIELIHNKPYEGIEEITYPYEELVCKCGSNYKIEFEDKPVLICEKCGEGKLGSEKRRAILKRYYPITLGRIMAALEKQGHYAYSDGVIYENSSEYGTHVCDWKLLKEHGEEATDDDQTNETIEALYKIIKKNCV